MKVGPCFLPIAGMNATKPISASPFCVDDRTALPLYSRRTSIVLSYAVSSDLGPTTALSGLLSPPPLDDHGDLG